MIRNLVKGNYYDFIDKITILVGDLISTLKKKMVKYIIEIIIANGVYFALKWLTTYNIHFMKSIYVEC